MIIRLDEDTGRPEGVRQEVKTTPYDPGRVNFAGWDGSDME
jgi:hypothetical protein